MKIDLGSLTIAEVHNSLVGGKFTAEDLAKEYQANIEKIEPEIKGYLEVFDDVIKQARRVDEKIKKGGNIGPLAGVPMAVKDNMLIKGRTSSAGSKILENFVAPYDATVIKKLKDSDIVFLGRTNMDEFAMGSSTENSAYGVTRNPHDTGRVPGGSSGGSTAVVASNTALVSLGSDTGGSVRQPASFCGVVGLKPTYGAVSRYGLIALGSSLDVIGPIGKTVSDVEIIFNAIKGKDPLDSTSFNPQEDRVSKVKNDALKIGVPFELVNSGGVDKEVLKNFKESIQHFESLGYEVKEIEMPNARFALAVYYIIMPAEASTNLARYDGIKYGKSFSEGKDLLSVYSGTRGSYFGREVRRRIMLGTYVLSSGYYDAYYMKADSVKELISSDFSKAFSEVDLILTPTSPTPAFRIGERAKDPLQMYLSDVLTVPANISGVPAISLPSGYTNVDGKKLPLGIQLISAHKNEELLFEAGKRFLNEK
jgi:aspartyl-tRNA(Asn)/glutamyl-tRNA(Gln) amidotransferase subunit A